jgi:DNA-directed RNA polymerase specialized sigma24 family protein
MTHEPYLHWLSRYFFAPGYDPEDMLQEARIAAWLAPRGLERVAARRRLIEIVRRSKRGGRPTFCQLHETADSVDVVDIVAARERLREILEAPYSDLQRVAIGRKLRGESCGEKRLDNALQVARRKLAA